MTTPTDADAQAAPLRQGLAARLAADGAIRSAAWRSAFEAVPRHVFTPRFHYRDTQGQVRELTRDAGPEWLSVVYSDTSLITQYDAEGLASSSSSQPSVMAVMLEALDVHDDDSVLDVATGTGYNTALLCHRLSDREVVSIDIDADLTRLARERLTALSHHPHLLTGDGMAGAPDYAPFDKIIVTCGTPRIPATLLDQLQPEGRIVTNIGRALVALDRTPSGAAGWLLPTSAAFMCAHSDHPTPAPPDQNESNPVTRVTKLSSEALIAGEFAILASLIAPDARHLWTEGTHTITDPGTGSQATFNKGSSTVAQHGQRELWTEMEEFYQRWLEAGQPSHDEFGLTIDHAGRHQLWHDRPSDVLATLPEHAGT